MDHHVALHMGLERETSGASRTSITLQVEVVGVKSVLRQMVIIGGFMGDACGVRPPLKCP